MISLAFAIKSVAQEPSVGSRKQNIVMMYSWSARYLVLLLTVVAAPTAVVCLLSRLLVKKKNAVKFISPPGPPGLPILGNLLSLWRLPHRTLRTLAEEYGPIMSIKLGRVPAVVVSSSTTAELFLTTHNHSFAERAPGDVGEYLLYGQKGMAMAEYGAYWQGAQKLFNLHLFSSRKVDALQPVRSEEIRRFIHSIRDATDGRRVPVDLNARVSALVVDVVCRTLFGKRCAEASGLVSIIRNAQELLGAFNANDYLPWVGVLDLQGLRRRMKSVRKAYGEFFDEVIHEHGLTPTAESKLQKDVDVLSMLLRSMGSGEGYILKDQSNIKAILLDLIIGAVDTMEAMTGWVMTELLQHPRVMTKLQQEIEEAVGKHRMVEEEDLARLSYLAMVIKETMRLHPVAPLLDRQCREDCVVGGFNISRGTRLLVNLWAIGRDPGDWDDGDVFFPERFTGSGGGAGDMGGRGGLRFPAFGAGSRRCPGMYMGMTMVKMVVAQLVHCFDWDMLGDGPRDELDMVESFGVAADKADRMLVVPAYRLSGVA